MARAILNSSGPSATIRCSSCHHRWVLSTQSTSTALYSVSQEMLETIRQKQCFTFDEYQTMLNLQCGVDPAEGESGIAKATDRNYGMYVIELHGLEINSSD